MEVMIKDLMDGNPIRGRKGWREAQTEVKWRRFWVFLLSAVRLLNTDWKGQQHHFSVNNAEFRGCYADPKDHRSLHNELWKWGKWREPMYSRAGRENPFSLATIIKLMHQKCSAFVNVHKVTAGKSEGIISCVQGYKSPVNSLTV